MTREKESLTRVNILLSAIVVFYIGFPVYALYWMPIEFNYGKFLFGSNSFTWLCASLLIFILRRRITYNKYFSLLSGFWLAVCVDDFIDYLTDSSNEMNWSDFLPVAYILSILIYNLSKKATR